MPRYLRQGSGRSDGASGQYLFLHVSSFAYQSHSGILATATISSCSAMEHLQREIKSWDSAHARSLNLFIRLSICATSATSWTVNFCLLRADIDSATWVC